MVVVANPPNLQLFTDEELLYLRARFYHPDTGRFTRVDPFAGNHDDPQSLHKYAYVHGDPINGVDPTGKFLVGLAVSVGIGALLGGGISYALGGSFVEGAIIGGLGGALGFASFAAISAFGSAYLSANATFWTATLGSGAFSGGTLQAGHAYYLGVRSPTELLKQGVYGAASGAAFAGIGGLVYRAAAPAFLRLRARPQGITTAEYDDFVRILLSEAGEFSDDIVLQGSRVKGTTTIRSDLDIGIRVSKEQFADLVFDAFNSPTLQNAQGRTLTHALKTGKLSASRAGLSSLRDELKRVLGVDVDLSIVQKGGPFDLNPNIPVQ